MTTEALFRRFTRQTAELNHTIQEIHSRIDPRSATSSNSKLAVIKRVTAGDYGFDDSVFRSLNRRAEYVECRYIAIYLSREMTDFPLNAIAKSFRPTLDHGIVIHGHRSISDRMVTDKALLARVLSVRAGCVAAMEYEAMPLFNLSPISNDQPSQ